MDTLRQLAVALPTLELLAAARRFTPVRSRYRGGGSLMESLLPVVISLGILALLIAVGWGIHYWIQQRKNRVIDDPVALFHELCRAHGLSRSDRNLLLAMAEWYELADPVTLFVDEQRWGNRRLHEELQCSEDAHRLARQLFGTH